MTITNFERSVVREFNKDLMKFLEAFSEKHGVEARFNKSTFSRDGSSNMVNIEFVVKGGATMKENKIEAHLKMMADILFPGIDIEKEFYHPSLGKFKLYGYDSRKRQYPVIVKTLSDGKCYKFDAERLRPFLT
jgi:hypothetical protein